MGNYYALELFSGVKRQIFFSEKGLPPSQFLTVFRPCDRAYPNFPSGFEDSDDPNIPSHAYVVSVPRMTERLEVMGFTLPRLKENVKRCLQTDRTELDQRIEYYDEQGVSFPSYYRKLKRQRRTLEQFTYNAGSTACGTSELVKVLTHFTSQKAVGSLLRSNVTC
jgi:hypothetical protein